MISFKASIAHKYFLFGLYDRQWSLTMPRSPKYVYYLNSMISYNASVAWIFVLFGLNDRQWSSKKSRSLIYVFYLFSMIFNDLLQCPDRPNMCLFWTLWSSMISYNASVPKCVSYLDSMIINDLLQSLSRLNLCLIWTQWSSMIFQRVSVAHLCFLFIFYDR